MECLLGVLNSRFKSKLVGDWIHLFFFCFEDWTKISQLHGVGVRRSGLFARKSSSKRGLFVGVVSLIREVPMLDWRDIEVVAPIVKIVSKGDEWSGLDQEKWITR